MSPKSAGLAIKWGHKKPLVYVDGLPVWKKSGNRIEPTIEHIQKGNIVIVDLRSSDKVEKGHLPRAYTIPFTKLEDYEDAFPGYNAPIYFYSDKDEEVRQAVATAKEWGYKNVIGYYDALGKWQNTGHKLQAGPATPVSDDAPINWQKKLGPGEISISNFTKSLKSADEGAYVRNSKRQIRRCSL